MNDVVSLLDLPTRTVVALAGGYVGYRISAVGKDADHRTVDVVFGALVFALICRVAGDLVAGLSASEVAGALGGMAATVLAAMIWRRWGEGLTARALHWMGISISDRYRTAWDPLRVDPRLRPSQLLVHLRDGDVLMCERLSRFDGRPTGACRFGSDGSVALYVTDRFPKGAADWVACDPDGPEDWGSLISYVPAAEISRIEVRY